MLIFDTLQYSKDLQSAGFTQPQAEMVAKKQRELIEEELATKADIKGLELKIEEVRASLELKIEALRTELKRDLVELEQRILIKLGALMVVAVSAVATLVKLL